MDPEADKAPAVASQPEAPASAAPLPAAQAEAATPAAAPIVEEALPTPGPSLLAEFDAEKAAKETKPEPAKAPAEPAKPADAAAKPEEPAKAAEAPVAAPVAGEWAYKLPETIKLDEAGKTRVNSMLDALVANPKDPASVQAIVDYHAERMAAHEKQLLREQHEVFVKTVNGWRADSKADAEIGGSGFKTSMAAVARMRDMFVAPHRREAFDRMLTTTGVGNHPEFLAAWHNAARFFDEPVYPSENAAPATGRGRAPGKRSLQDIYRAGASADGR